MAIPSCTRSFFDLGYQNFLSAASHAEELTKFYRLAGFSFCIKFAGNAMVSILTTALKHLETDALKDCDLTICAWESTSLKLPWDTCSIRGEAIGFDCDPIPTVLDIHTKALHMFDREKGVALYWIRDAQTLPWWVKGSPLQLILHWWMRTKGHQLTHAAAVGYPHGGVLLAGKGGSGKSTTSLSCMKAGMQYASEDFCILSDVPNCWVYSVYNSAKITSQTLQQFPELRKHIDNRDRTEEDKAFFFHHQFQPEKVLFGFPLKAVITLKIEPDENSWMEPIAPMELLPSLSVTTIWQLTHTGLVTLKHLQRVAEHLPCYRLHLGRDLGQAPQLIEALL